MTQAVPEASKDAVGHNVKGWERGASREDRNSSSLTQRVRPTSFMLRLRRVDKPALLGAPELPPRC